MAKAAWLKGYLDASFRGAPFFVKGHRYQGGRRLAEHVFPEREDIEYEDLGKAPRLPSLSGYVLADNYFPMRNNLMKALDAKGASRLVHPYLGVMEVHCDTYAEMEITEEGRLARFEFNFKRKADEDLTTAVDTIGQVFDAKSSLQSEISAWLDSVYSLAKKPVQAIEDLNATLNSGLDTIDKLKRIANTQAEFKRALSNTRGKLIELQLSALSLAQSFGGLIDYGTGQQSGITFSANTDNAREQYEELRELANFGTAVVTNTPEEIFRTPDYPAYQVQQMIVYYTVASMAGLFTIIPFDSSDEAEATQQDYFSLLDTLMTEVSISDELYANLRNIKATVHADLEVRTVTLPRVVDFQLPETNNTLFISNEIYGNIEEEADVIARNGIAHPGFVSAAKVLKVRLND